MARKVKSEETTTTTEEIINTAKKIKIKKAYTEMTEEELENAGVPNAGIVYDAIQARKHGMTYGKWKGRHLAPKIYKKPLRGAKT